MKPVAIVFGVSTLWLGACHPKAEMPAKPVEGPAQTAPMASLADISSAQTFIDRGQKLYSYNCVSCHGEGKDHPGTAALLLKYNGTVPAALADRGDIAPNLTKYYVRHGVSIMPFFRRTEISDAELDAIAQYLARNLSPPKTSADMAEAALASQKATDQ